MNLIEEKINSLSLRKYFLVYNELYIDDCHLIEIPHLVTDDETKAKKTVSDLNKFSKEILKEINSIKKYQNKLDNEIKKKMSFSIDAYHVKAKKMNTFIMANFKIIKDYNDFQSLTYKCEKYFKFSYKEINGV